ncbi:MAG: hypothetical protein OHK0044_20220 [Burkholderiaceae bacterium]
MALLVGPDRRIVADAVDPRRRGRPFASAALIDAARESGRAAFVSRFGERAYRFVAIALAAPKPGRWVVLGAQIDDALAAELRQLTGLEVSFFGTCEGGTPVDLASTLTATRRAALGAALRDRALQPQVRMSLRLAGTEYETRVLPVGDGDGDGGSVFAVPQRPLDEMLGAFDRLRMFLLVLAAISIAFAVAASYAIARAIVGALRAPIESEGQPIDVAASIGIALYPEDGVDAGTLMRRADIAMYVAKRSSASFAFYDARYEVAQREHLSLLGELRRAVEAAELRAYYQPKVELATGRISGVEALVRWRHPTRGLVPPGEFMPYAEQTGFVRVITRWMLAVTLRQCGRWAAQGTPLQVAVNISVRDLLSRDLPQLVGDLLQKDRVPPELVCLEITESSFMEDPEHALATLRALHDLGVRLAIDDFGTGFSSLAYLKRLPVDELKIDRTFVMGMADDRDDRMIVHSTIELAHNLGLKVVAEGVETDACLDELRVLGCDLVQGYLISGPLRRSKLETWLRESPWGVAQPAAVVVAD